MTPSNLALMFLGLTLVIVALALSVLGYAERPIPDPLAMLGTGALGGLVGLLVPGPRRP